MMVLVRSQAIELRESQIWIRVHLSKGMPLPDWMPLLAQQHRFFVRHWSEMTLGDFVVL
jgi:hypothetical protein